MVECPLSLIVICFVCFSVAVVVVAAVVVVERPT